MQEVLQRWGRGRVGRGQALHSASHPGVSRAHHAARNVQSHLQAPPLIWVEGGGAVQQLEERAARNELCDDAQVRRLGDCAQLQQGGAGGG